MRSTADRFWSKVSGGDVDSCWVWTGFCRNGYGRFSPRPSEALQAHRYAYELLVGPIPAGLELDHLCRERSCVNPWHLDPVPHAVNMARRWARYVPATHCAGGHEWSPETTYIRPKDGKRACRPCQTAASARWAARNNNPTREDPTP